MEETGQQFYQLLSREDSDAKAHSGMPEIVECMYEYMCVC